MTNITKQDIEALIDDELGHEASKRVLQHIEDNRDARKAYDEMQAQKRVLKMWWNVQRIG